MFDINFRQIFVLNLNCKFMKLYVQGQWINLFSVLVKCNINNSYLFKVILSLSIFLVVSNVIPTLCCWF